VLNLIRDTNKKQISNIKNQNSGIIALR